MQPILLYQCCFAAIRTLGAMLRLMSHPSAIHHCGSPCLLVGKAAVFYIVRMALATISAYAEVQLVR